MQPEYQIHELAEKAGVSVRTIRFYIDEGVLPVPATRGRYSVYSPEYIDRLALIRVLKDAYLPLKEIRQRMNSLDWDQVKAALAQPPTMEAEQGHLAHEASSSASDYIANLLKNQSRGTQPGEIRSSQPAAPQQESGQPEIWERIILAPGVELHIRRNRPSQDRSKTQQLIEFAKKLFS